MPELNHEAIALAETLNATTRDLLEARMRLSIAGAEIGKRDALITELERTAANLTTELAARAAPPSGEE